MKYQRLTEREAPLVMTLWEATKVYNRLIELENKIENGELISTVQSEQGEQEIEFFVKHNAKVREQAVKEFLRTLRDIDEQGTTESFWVGWSVAINTAFKKISEKYNISMEEVCGDDSSRAGKTKKVAL